jgi:hypothetical protein
MDVRLSHLTRHRQGHGPHAGGQVDGHRPAAALKPPDGLEGQELGRGAGDEGTRPDPQPQVAEGHPPEDVGHGLAPRPATDQVAVAPSTSGLHDPPVLGHLTLGVQAKDECQQGLGLGALAIARPVVDRRRPPEARLPLLD